MKFLINKGVLENMLLNIQSFYEKKDLSQITSHLLITAEENNLNIKATDFEIGLSIDTKNCKIEEEGKTTVNGKKLLEIVKIFKDEDVILEASNDNIIIKQKSSKFKLPTFNPNEFPSFPSLENKSKFEINNSKLVRSLKKITSAIDSNNPKYELNGALIDIKKDKINFVGTDTKRLALISIENNTEKEISIILPKKAVLEIQKLFFDDIEIFYDENTFIAKSDNYLFFTKLINGKFPDYERIIPKSAAYKLNLSREKILEAIKQIKIVSLEIKIIFKNDAIIFESLNSDNLEAKTQIEEKLDLTSDLTLGLNSKFLEDFISNIDSSIFTLEYNDSNLPITLKSENFNTVVMPIML